MKLINLKAEPHPYGNSICLSWHHPQPETCTLIRVIRRERSYPLVYEPAAENDGSIVLDYNMESAVRFHLPSDSIRYLDAMEWDSLSDYVSEHADIILSSYASFKIEEAGKKWSIADGENIFFIRLIDDKLKVYGRSKIMDTGLKGDTVYYYTLYPYDPAGGYVFNRLNRISSPATSPHNFAKYMYDLLPAIYHRYDAPEKGKGLLERFLEVPGSMLDKMYSMTGHLLDACNIEKVHASLLPLLSEWIGWNFDYNTEPDQQRNEIRDAPGLYGTIGLIPAVESTVKRITGWNCLCKEFVHNVFLSNKPERLNLWLQKKDKLTGVLSSGLLSLDFAYEGRPSIVNKDEKTAWLFYHTLRGKEWQIWCKRYADNDFQPSRQLYSDKNFNRHPQACALKNNILVFWDVYDEQNELWSINAGYFDEKTLKPCSISFNKNAEKKSPFPLVMPDNTFWLFWLDKKSKNWILKYNRFSLTMADESGCSLTTVLPDKEVRPFNMDTSFSGEDIFIFLNDKTGAEEVFLIWAQKKYIGEIKSKRYRLFYTRNNPDLGADTWKDIIEVPVIEEDPGMEVNRDFHMKEPSLIVIKDKIALYFSCNKDSTWAVWQGFPDDPFDSKMTQTLFSERDPLPFFIGEDIFLLYRSNMSITYKSKIYQGMITTDARYAGSTAVDSRNTSRIAVMDEYDDSLSYTYDLGKPGDLKECDWYSRNTLGIYITPDTGDPDIIKEKINRLKRNLGEFMPVTDRAVIILKDYDDTIIEVTEESVIGLSDSSEDSIE